MPPHLHPRSRMTSSLFATTVVASFVVVALPHILPCPVPATKYADGEVVVDGNGRRLRWRRRDADDAEQQGGIVRFDQAGGGGGGGGDDDAAGPGGRRRECPVPKPGGLLGEWLGFHKEGPAGRKTGDR